MTTSLEGFRNITDADVYKAGRLAAALTRRPDGSTEFRYRAEYLADAAEPVATTLPLLPDPVHSPSGSSRGSPPDGTPARNQNERRR